MKHEYTASGPDYPAVPPSREVQEEERRLHAAKGESARHNEIQERIEAAIEPVDRTYNAWLNDLLRQDPTLDDEALGELVAKAVNVHRAPAIFRCTDTFRGANADRSYVAFRLADNQQLSTRSTRVVRHADAHNPQAPLTFDVDIPLDRFGIQGPAPTDQHIAQAIFTDFNAYGGDKQVPDFLYNGDLSRGEGGWVANVQLLEGLVDQQFDRIGIPKHWYK